MRRRLVLNSNNTYIAPIDSNYLTITALENELTVSLSVNSCQYNIDGGTWQSLSAGSETPPINKGSFIQIKASNPTITSDLGIGTFTITKQCILSGNCMSMLYGDSASDNNSISAYAFKDLFTNCNVISVSNNFLPAEILSECCYYRMFKGCSNLRNSPKLPASILKDACYAAMFSGTKALPDCSSIDFADSSVVNSGGLRSLFNGTIVSDEDLFKILPINSSGHYCLPVTILTSNSYNGMFNACNNLTTTPDLPATTLFYNCYAGMFSDCKNLINIRELPATVLADSCYSGMFMGCTSLTKMPILHSTDLNVYCYYRMFKGCTSLTEVTSLPATTVFEASYREMFSGCTNLITAPEIFATRLVSKVCQEMFYKCSNLNYIKIHSTNGTSSCLSNWTSGVASSGTFVKKASTSFTTGVNGIPSGWTVQSI